MKTEWYRLHDFQLGRFPSWPVQYVHNLLPVSTLQRNLFTLPMILNVSALLEIPVAKNNKRK